MEGWPVDYYEYTVVDMVIAITHSLSQITQDNNLLTSIKEAEILENTFKVGKAKLILQPKTLLSYIQLVNMEIEAFGIDQKVF